MEWCLRRDGDVAPYRHVLVEAVCRVGVRHGVRRRPDAVADAVVGVAVAVRPDRRGGEFRAAVVQPFTGERNGVGRVRRAVEQVVFRRMPVDRLPAEEAVAPRDEVPAARLTRQPRGEHAPVRHRVDRVRHIRAVVGERHQHDTPRRVREGVAAHAILGIVEARLRRMADVRGDDRRLHGASELVVCPVDGERFAPDRHALVRVQQPVVVGAGVGRAVGERRSHGLAGGRVRVGDRRRGRSRIGRAAHKIPGVVGVLAPGTPRPRRARIPAVVGVAVCDARAVRVPLRRVHAACGVEIPLRRVPCRAAVAGRGAVRPAPGGIVAGHDRIGVAARGDRAAERVMDIGEVFNGHAVEEIRDKRTNRRTTGRRRGAIRTGRRISSLHEHFHRNGRQYTTNGDGRRTDRNFAC